MVKEESNAIYLSKHTDKVATVLLEHDSGRDDVDPYIATLPKVPPFSKPEYITAPGR